MTLYLVRQSATGHPGSLLAVLAAKSLEELFWLVDEWADPTVCEYAAMPAGGGLHLDARLEADPEGHDFVSIDSIREIQLSASWSEDAAVAKWSRIPYPKPSKQ